jgi:uncharacterized protein (DUF736 family)
MSGTLFKNEKKKSENHPDYTGSCKIDNVEWDIAGWKKTTNSGKSFLSLSFSEPWEKRKQSEGGGNGYRFQRPDTEEELTDERDDDPFA